MEKRTALVFGATGMVGTSLVNELIYKEVYSRIILFSRSDIHFTSEKISLIKDDLIFFETIADKILGDDVYCCLGTTIKKAGSPKAFERIDLELPALIAEAAEKNSVKNFAVISSVGANALSNNFYLRTKGRMENEVLKRHFNNLVILRPSLLIGNRKEYRFGENIAQTIFPIFDPLLGGNLKKFRSISAKDVARSMINLTLFPQDKKIFEWSEIKQMAEIH